MANAIRSAVENCQSELTSSDVSDDGFEAQEGRILTRLHRSRERNRALVEKRKAKALKKTGALACEACGIDFEKRYGERGRGFIECHHTKPVHTLVEGVKTTLEDLALVCANCHRIIHSAKPWLTLEELKRLLR